MSRLSLVAQWELLPSCGVLVSFRSSFSCCREQVLGQQASVISACGVYSTGLVPVAHRLSYSMAHRIQPYLGSNLCPLEGRFLSSGPPGKLLERKYFDAHVAQNHLLQNTLILPCCDCSPLKGELGQYLNIK